MAVVPFESEVGSRGQQPGRPSESKDGESSQNQRCPAGARETEVLIEDEHAERRRRQRLGQYECRHLGERLVAIPKESLRDDRVGRIPRAGDESQSNAARRKGGVAR